jgi:amidase
VGVARNLAGFDPRVDALFEEALDALRAAGAELIDPADVPHADEYEESEWEVLRYEFKADIEGYLATLGGEAPRTLADLIAFNEAHRADELPFFGQESFELSVEKGPLTEPAYLEALARCGRLSREEGLDAVIAEHALDAIVAPTRGPAWLTDHINGDHHGPGGSSSPAAVSGYPSVTVPMGSIAGLPVGLSFIGGPRRDHALIGYAFAFEQSTNHRVAPRFLETADPSTLSA